jgi:nicotinamidase-related amidase
MPLTQLDPATALIVIDMQKGIVALPVAHPIQPIVENVAALARAFRARDLPVVLVNVTGRAPGRTEASFNFSPPPDWAELIPELDQQASDFTVTKMNVGAFYGTALERILRRSGVTRWCWRAWPPAAASKRRRGRPTIRATMSCWPPTR